MTLSIRYFRGVLAFSLMGILVSIPHVAVAEVTVRDGFVGVVTKSENNKLGSQIVFASLRSPLPFVTWPSGNGVYTEKAFEDDELIVLFFVANITGGTETFYLNKKTKRFTLVEVAVLEARVMNKELKPTITFGRLQ